jgi:hypothetical protein
MRDHFARFIESRDPSGPLILCASIQDLFEFSVAGRDSQIAMASQALIASADTRLDHSGAGGRGLEN